MFGLGSQQAGWSLRRIAVVKSLPESVSLPGRLPKKLFGTGFAELPLRFQCRKVLWCSFRWRLKVFQEQRKIAPLECYQFSCFCWTCSGYCQRAPSRRRSLPGLKGSSIKLFFRFNGLMLSDLGGQSLGYWHAFLGFLNLFSWIETFGGG